MKRVSVILTRLVLVCWYDGYITLHYLIVFLFFYYMQYVFTISLIFNSIQWVIIELH